MSAADHVERVQAYLDARAEYQRRSGFTGRTGANTIHSIKDVLSGELTDTDLAAVLDELKQLRACHDTLHDDDKKLRAFIVELTNTPAQWRLVAPDGARQIFPREAVIGGAPWPQGWRTETRFVSYGAWREPEDIGAWRDVEASTSDGPGATESATEPVRVPENADAPERPYATGALITAEQGAAMVAELAFNHECWPFGLPSRADVEAQASTAPTVDPGRVAQWQQLSAESDPVGTVAALRRIHAPWSDVRDARMASPEAQAGYAKAEAAFEGEGQP